MFTFSFHNMYNEMNEYSSGLGHRCRGVHVVYSFNLHLSLKFVIVASSIPSFWDTTLGDKSLRVS